MTGTHGSLPDDQGGKFNRRATAVNLNGATGVKFAVPTSARWKLYFIQIKLVTSATVGSRLILVQLRDSSGNIYHEIVNNGTYGTGRTVAGSTTERYELTIISDGASKGVTLTSLLNAPFIMAAGEDIFIKDTAAIDVTDQVSAEIQVEEWIET